MEEEVLGANLESSITPLPDDDIVVSTMVSGDSDLATVEASPDGDIVNGVLTSNNPVPESASTQFLNTSAIEDYTNANKGLPASSVGTPQVEIINPLHSYASYTYGLSFHMMTPDTHKKVTEDPRNIDTATICLVASAGKYNDKAFRRADEFAEDFYFDDLRITTIIGSTPMSKAGNAIDISFTLIEPNGFTFINRLLGVATNSGAQNYLQIPYLLRVDFYGYTDAGLPAALPISGQTKYIPIKLTGVKTKVAAKGAEYKITAVPFNHSAFQQSVAVTPVNFQVQAATVRDFFGSGSTSSEGTTAATDNERAESLKKKLAETTDLTLKADIQTQLNQMGDLNQAYTIKEGYSNAINSWYAHLQTKLKRYTRDTVSIVADPEIANSVLVVPEKNDTRRMANSTRSELNSARSAALGGGTTGGPKFTEGYFPVYAGQPIDKVIETAVRNSSYILKQITDPVTDNPEEIATKLGRPLKWFKIIPKVTLGDYDYATGQYAKHITYYVKTWTVANKVPVGPMGKASGFVKKYNYIYTGHNSDIIDVSLDFDMLYYVQMTANKTENQLAVDMKRPNYSVYDKNIPEIYPSYTVNPKMVVNRSQDVQYSGQGNSARDPKTLASGDLAKDLAGSARGDMINVKLTILGDPTFIKQDDVFYNQTAYRIGGLLTPNGSLVMDEGELYVMLIFKTPTDYDEITGLYRNDKYSWSMFSGIYKVITVDNQFSHGKFQQVLSLVRLSNQPQFDDLVGGQYSKVLQYQRIEQQIVRALLTPLNTAVRTAIGAMLNALSPITNIISAAMQIAQNAQSIALGMLNAVVSNAINRVTDAASAWVKTEVLTPLENWTKENILQPVETWFTEMKDSVSDWFYDTFTSTGDKLYDMFSNASFVDIGSMTANPEVFSWISTEMGFEQFDAVDPGVLDSIDF